jgi:hypothetical protein
MPDCDAWRIVAWTPSGSGECAASIPSVMTACPFGVSSMSFTEPTGVPSSST